MDPLLEEAIDKELRVMATAKVKVLEGVPVDPSPEYQLGTFANAFRVLGGPEEEECCLDFLLYSTVENRARVISRVRVRREFLPALLDHISGDLEDFSQHSWGGLASENRATQN